MRQAQCPACARPQEPRLICAFCGTPLAVELDYFTALGLPRRLTIDLRDLEKRYHGLGRRVHPDRFANREVTVRTASLSATALLTRAFRTLRDPVSRGLYWLELHGEKLAADNKRVPPELAELIFEVQETLADLRASNPTGASNGAHRDLRVEVARYREAVGENQQQALAELERNFTHWDSAQRSASELTVELKAILSRIAYVRTLIRDVDRELGQLGAI